MKVTTPRGRWIAAYWSELGILSDRGPGPGRVFIPPPVNEISFAHRLWQGANEQTGTILDQFECDNLEPAQCAKLAEVIRVHQRMNYGDRAPSRLVVDGGQPLAPVSRPLVAEIERAEMARHLLLLARFLEDAARQRKKVTIDL